MTKMEHLCVGFLENNVYLVFSEETGILYLIDPAAEPERILEKAKQYPYKEAVVLLTHAHADHIGALKEVVSVLNIRKVLLHPDDLVIYNSPQNKILPFLPALENLPETQAPCDCADFKVSHTPGHTPGGVCYEFPAIPALFSGDTLFASSVGRTDLPGGDEKKLLNSIRSSILILSDNLAVYPGHGPDTTVGYERKHNPYLG